MKSLKFGITLATSYICNAKTLLEKTLALKIQEKNSRVFFVFSPHSRCEGKGAINLVRFSFTCPRPVLAGAGTLQREKLLLTTIKESASESVAHLSSCPPTCLYSLSCHLIQTLVSYLLTFLPDLRPRALVFLSVKKVRKLQIRFQVFIVIFIFISEFNKFVGFL